MKLCCRRSMRRAADVDVYSWWGNLRVSLSSCCVPVSVVVIAVYPKLSKCYLLQSKVRKLLKGVDCCSVGRITKALINAREEVH